MAAKLRLTSRTIPWSLLVKAFTVAFAWLVLPYWLFSLLALLFYFVPFFEPSRLALPLALLLFFAGFVPHGLWSALLLALVFFLILGIKNLVLVDRAAAYETLAFILFFLATLTFFGFFQSPAGQLFAASAALALIFALLLKNLLGFSENFLGLSSRERFLLPALGGLLIWQWTFAVLVLPMNYFYQTALVFMCGVVLAELVLNYLNRALGSRKILAYFSVFFAVLAVILAANNWKI